MSLPSGEKPFDWVEVRFKNGRKDYYKNAENLTLSIGDIVATQAQSGHDIGMVTFGGISTRTNETQKYLGKAS